MSYFKYNVNSSKRVGMEGVFLRLEGLLLANPLHPSSFTWINPFYQKKNPMVILHCCLPARSIPKLFKEYDYCSVAPVHFVKYIIILS